MEISKLKTLKELERYGREPTQGMSYQRPDSGNCVKVVKVKTIRAEAVKWVKRVEGMKARIVLIDFFNLTEEDLE